MKAPCTAAEPLNVADRPPPKPQSKPSWGRAGRPPDAGSVDQSCTGSLEDIEEELAAQLVVRCELGMGGPS